MSIHFKDLRSLERGFVLKYFIRHDLFAKYTQALLNVILIVQ